MATIDEVFELTKYRANKAGYLGTVSSKDFNLLFPRAEIRYYNQLYANYAANERISDSMSPFKTDPLVINIDVNGQWPSPSNLLHVDALLYASPCTPFEPVPIMRVEPQRLAENLSSTYDAPNFEFPIYTEYRDPELKPAYIQFYPTSLGQATLIYLKKPRVSKWGSTLNGSIGATGTIIGGTGYVDGSYTNVPLTGGAGNSALANITVSGTAVSAVQIVYPGFEFLVGDTLSASNTRLGGSGAGFSFPVSTIINAREVYDPSTSIDPLWLDTDIDNIIYQVLQDLGVNFRDAELEQFAINQAKTQQ